jgi:FtsZ-binding cell division protein ZapB
MVTLEQVRLLETKVAKAIDFVKQVTEENNALKGKVDSYERRIDELEILIQHFKEDQGRIEDSILSALDRLNQFEDAIEKSLSPVRHESRRTENAALKPETKAVPSGKTPEPDEAENDQDPLGEDISPPTEEPKAHDEFLFEEDAQIDPVNTAEEPPNGQTQNNTELDIF